MNYLYFEGVKNIYDFAIKNQSKLEKSRNRKLTDKELINDSLSLMLHKIENVEVEILLGTEVYNECLRLNKLVENRDAREYLEVFDEVMYKCGNIERSEKINFLERKIVNDNRDMIPFIAAKLGRKYFSGSEVGLRMNTYRNPINNLN